MKLGKKNRGNQEVNLSSSSDIAFLLIIFFLVTSGFIFKDGMRISLPAESTEPMIVSKDRVSVITIEGPHQLLLNDEEVTKDMIIKTVEQQSKLRTDLIVLIQVRGKVPYQYVIEIVEIMKRLEINQFSLKMI